MAIQQLSEMYDISRRNELKTNRGIVTVFSGNIKSHPACFSKFNISKFVGEEGIRMSCETFQLCGEDLRENSAFIVDGVLNFGLYLAFKKLVENGKRLERIETLLLSDNSKSIVSVSNVESKDRCDLSFINGNEVYLAPEGKSEIFKSTIDTFFDEAWDIARSDYAGTQAAFSRLYQAKIKELKKKEDRQ